MQTVSFKPEVHEIIKGIPAGYQGINLLMKGIVGHIISHKLLLLFTEISKGPFDVVAVKLYGYFVLLNSCLNNE